MTDKFVSPCPPPDAREREILDCLSEEAAEVIQRAMKADRFGLLETQPGKKWNNRERLSHEVGQLQAIIDMAVDEGLLCGPSISNARASKPAKLRKYMQTEPRRSDSETGSENG